MISSRRILPVFLACCVAAPLGLPAQDQQPSPVNLGKEFSADVIVTGEDGAVIRQKIFTENGLVRSEVQANNMPMVVILRPDQQKIYSVMTAQKMVMVMPYDPGKMKEQMALATGLDGNYETEGTETINDIPCAKYKYTSKEGKVYDLWVDPTTKLPVKMAAADHTFTMIFSHYQAGPQPASLFDVPADYQVVSMPSLPNLPAGSQVPGTPAPAQP